MTKLVIVESKLKAKQIAGFLGSGWKVEASKGYVRDLPNDSLGIDIANGFQAEYLGLSKKGTVVRRLLKAMYAAEAVYLATDPGGEGEMLAWHIREVAELPPSIPVYRIIFNDLSEAGILAGVNAPRALNTKLVEAQQARREINRLVGYLVTAPASRLLGGKQSIGWLPGVCLRQIVQREFEMQAFNGIKYWTLGATFDTEGGEVKAQLASVKGIKRDQLTLEQADMLTKILSVAMFWVGHVTQEETRLLPAPPFTASTLQQGAFEVLGWSLDETMRVAYGLYEAGLITFIQTDSTAIAPEAQAVAREFISQQYGVACVSDQMPNHVEVDGEAIRPLDVSATPNSLGEQMDEHGAKLYDLIWKRFVASQMTEARYSHTSATICAGIDVDTPYPLEFRVEGHKLLFDGFLKVGQNRSDESLEDELPPLSNCELLRLTELLRQERTTQGPEQYTESSLVEALAAHGVGRSSAFADSLKSVKDKGYVTLENGRPMPTPAGLRLCEFLIAYFPRVFEASYAAYAEALFDSIAAGTTTRLDVLTAFWKDFEPALKAVSQLAEQKALTRQTAKPTGQQCPRCGKPLVERRAKTGQFVGCSGYPTCRFSTAVDRYIPQPKQAQAG